MIRYLARPSSRQCTNRNLRGLTALAWLVCLFSNTGWCHIDETANNAAGHSTNNSTSHSLGYSSSNSIGDFLVGPSALNPPLPDLRDPENDSGPKSFGLPWLFPQWLPMSGWITKGLDTTRKITDALLTAWQPVSYLDNNILPAAYQNTEFSGFYQPLADTNTGFYLSADYEEPWEQQREFNSDVLTLEGGGGFTYALDEQFCLRWGINGRLLNDQNHQHDWDFDLRSSLGITYQF